MKSTDLATKAKITWCPGCPNSAILVAFREVAAELIDTGRLKKEHLVAFAGIGCHGKISDYVNINSFTSLHGRLIPAMTGAKCANPELTIVGFSGDGDSFSEGIEHLIHAARRNSDIKLFVHDNQVFALTTGQATSLTKIGFKGKSTPFGSYEYPFDSLLLALSAGASFVARAYAPNIAGTKKIMQAAMAHKGFAYVDIVQPCLTFFDTREYFKDKVFDLTDVDLSGDIDRTKELIPRDDGKIPLGIFYRVTKPTFEESMSDIIS